MTMRNMMLFVKILGILVLYAQIITKWNQVYTGIYHYCKSKVKYSRNSYES
jgi:hypothetical protein